MSMKNLPGLSRREFLSTAAGAGGAALLAPAWLKAATLSSDPRMAQVKAKTIAIDMHNHIFSGAAGLRLPAGKPGEAPLPSLSEQLKLGGFTAVVAGYKIPFDPNARPGETNGKLHNWLTMMDEILEKEHIRRALTLKDLETAHLHDQPTVVQSIEGAQFLEGHLERIEPAYKRGLRQLQLLHDDDDPVSPLGDLDSKPAHLGGLTPFGAEVIKECNRLGILVDLAHASPETLLAATKVATKPFILSHTGFDYPVDENQRMFAMVKSRLLTKERAKVIADQGGVIGIWIYLSRSPKEYVENVRHMVDAVGIDHVGIGSDTDLLSAPGKGTNYTWPGMTSGFFTTVAEEMLSQGFTPEEIAKFGGGNYCRLFANATAPHT